MKKAALICSSFVVSCSLISSALAIGFDTGSTHGSTTSRSWNDSSGHHYQSDSSSTSTSFGAHVDNDAIAGMGASLLGSMIAKNTAKPAPQPVPQQPKADEKLEPFLADSQFPLKIKLTAANAKKQCNIICDKNDGEWTGDWLPAKGKAKASCTCHIKIFGNPVQDDF